MEDTNITGLELYTTTNVTMVNDTTSNVLCYRVPVNSSVLWIASIIFLSLSLVICVGNGLVIIVCLKSSTLRSNYSSYLYIINLAVADFGAGLVLPVNILGLWYPEIMLFSSYVCAFRFSLFNFFGSASIYLLAALTYDRYVAITEPLRYHDIMTTRKHIIACFLAWVPALLIGWLMPLLWHNPFDVCPSCTIGSNMSRNYYRFISIPVVTTISLFIIILYIRIFVIANRQRKRISDLDVASQMQAQEQYHSLKQQMKRLKVGLTIFAAYYISFLPFFIIIAVQMYGGVFNSLFLNTIRLLSTFILPINSCVNPFIYTYKLPPIRQGLKLLMGMNTVEVENNIHLAPPGEG